MTQNTLSPAPRRSGGRRDQHQGRHWRRDLIAGGTEGNERLTVLCGLLLIVLLAGLGLTILRIHDLLWLHIFLGCVLVSPVGLKLGSVGYRLGRYYTGDPAYRMKGPPPLPLRALAPLVVFFTLAVFATGGMMLLLGPSSRGSLLMLHKASFFGWIAVVALHIVAHLPDLWRWLSGALRARQETLGYRHGVAAPTIAVAGRTGRGAALVGALLGGLVIAIAFSGQITAFTHAVLGH